MNLSLDNFIEWRRQEISNPDLQQLPGYLLAELPQYIQQIQQNAGPRPSEWPEDCEALAAMALIDDIFRLRRQKIECAVGTSPDISHTFGNRALPFEARAIAKIYQAYRELDQDIREIRINGKV